MLSIYVPYEHSMYISYVHVWLGDTQAYLFYVNSVIGRYYLPNPSARAGYDTRSIFKRSLTGFNSEFSFS